MYRTLYSHLASKLRYISHLGHTPNTAEPLAFKQGAVQFCAPQRGCSDGIIPPLICTQPNPFVRVKITLSSEHFKEENDFPLAHFNQNKLHTRNTIPPRSMTNDPNRESNPRDPRQQRHAQKKEQIFVCLPKKGYLCIL